MSPDGQGDVLEHAITLRTLTLADEAGAKRAHAELNPDDFRFLIGWKAGTPWQEYIDRLERERLGTDLAPGRVRCSFLLAIVDDQIVGRLSIRHFLNEELRRVGGHIGYTVLPEFRRRGYATDMTRAALKILSSEGLEEVLMTCDDDNVTSAGVIERCSGRLIDVVDGVRRYAVRTT